MLVSVRLAAGSVKRLLSQASIDIKSLVTPDLDLSVFEESGLILDSTVGSNNDGMTPQASPLLASERFYL